MSEIRIVAELDLKPGCRDDLIPILRALVEGSRAEAGNKAYNLTEDLEKPGHFFVVETWASAKAIEEHNATPHFQAFVRAIDGKSEKLAITKLKNLF